MSPPLSIYIRIYVDIYVYPSLPFLFDCGAVNLVPPRYLILSDPGCDPVLWGAGTGYAPEFPGPELTSGNGSAV